MKYMILFLIYLATYTNSNALIQTTTNTQVYIKANYLYNNNIYLINTMRLKEIHFAYRTLILGIDINNQLKLLTLLK